MTVHQTSRRLSHTRILHEKQPKNVLAGINVDFRVEKWPKVDQMVPRESKGDWICMVSPDFFSSYHDFGNPA